MNDLHFDAEKHEYTKDGLIVPSVTQILAPLTDYSMVPVHILKRKAAIGTAVHRACELDDLGKLAESSVMPLLKPYLAAWRLFKDEHQPEILENESRMFHVKHWYAGTLDRVCIIDDKVCIIDIKTTVKLMPAVGPQLSGYQEAYNYRRKEKATHRAAVQLKPDGTYHLAWHQNPQDLATFMACLTIKNWSNKHG